MAEAAIEAEDEVAGGGNMPDRRDPATQEPVAMADRKRLRTKEAIP
jgi:hypothetical protein